MKIYLASSGRNTYQSSVLETLRNASHDVYDFKNPTPGNTGFSWKQCDPELSTNLTVDRMRSVLTHPIANEGFQHDYKAMKWADICVLLLPSGMSAHLEAGWFAGACKPVVICAPEIREPELMYKCFDDANGATPIFASVEEVIAHLPSLITTTKFITCETDAAVVLHARRVGVTPLSLSDHVTPRPKTLCDLDAAWDTRLPINAVQCSLCISALNTTDQPYKRLLKTKGELT